MATTKKITPVMLAKDVLKLIDAKVIVPANGSGYVRLLDRQNQNLRADAQAALKARTVKCKVCGIGATFVAHVFRTNGVSVAGLSETGWSSSGWRRANEVFGNDQAQLIEIAFERWIGRTAEDENARKFGERYRSSRSRLIAIMQNIVANRGTFKPEVKPAKR